MATNDLIPFIIEIQCSFFSCKIYRLRHLIQVVQRNNKDIKRHTIIKHSFIIIISDSITEQDPNNNNYGRLIEEAKRPGSMRLKPVTSKVFNQIAIKGRYNHYYDKLQRMRWQTKGHPIDGLNSSFAELLGGVCWLRHENKQVITTPQHPPNINIIGAGKRANIIHIHKNEWVHYDE